MTLITPKFPPAAKKMTEINLCGWIGQAAVGDILEYHRGFLALDASPQGKRLAEADRAELIRVAQRAWWASERGLVHLVQRRIGPDEFRYFAIARLKPAKAEPSVSQLITEEAA